MIFVIVIINIISVNVQGAEFILKEGKIKVTSKVVKDSKPYLTTELNIPVISGMLDSNIEKSINKTLYDDAVNFKNSIEASALENYSSLLKAGVEVTPFQVITKYNLHYLNDYLSLIVTYYEYRGGAHGIYNVVPYNYNLKTGERLQIKDIFKEGYDYKSIINQEILSEISKHPDNYFKDAFKTIKENQDFYFTKEGIVVYFQVYEIAPFAAGNPEFLIPYSKIYQGLKVKFN